MQAVDLVNQFFLFVLLWLCLIPVTYILTVKKTATLLQNIGFTIGSIALSFLLIMFSYTLLINIGMITLLAKIHSILPNIIIIILIMMAPVLVIAGHHKLEHYNRGQQQDNS